MLARLAPQPMVEPFFPLLKREGKTGNASFSNGFGILP